MPKDYDKQKRPSIDQSPPRPAGRTCVKTCIVWEDFTRAHPAEKKCKNCRLPNKNLQARNDQVLEKLINNHVLDWGTQSEVRIESQQTDDTETKSLNDHIQALEKTVIDLKLKLIIAENFISLCKTKTQILPVPPHNPLEKQKSYAECHAQTLKPHEIAIPTIPTLRPHHRIIIKPKQNLYANMPKLSAEKVIDLQRRIERSLPIVSVNFDILNMRPMENGGVLVELPT